jgi:CBS domain containing-hemolysin-like protein
MSYILGVIIATLIISAFFSGMEIAFVSANRLRIELNKKQNKFPSGILKIFIKRPAFYITTMMLGNTIALVVYGIFMQRALDPLFSRYIHSGVVIFILQTIIATIVILIIAEILPKAVFRLKPNNFLNIFALPVFVFYVISYPITGFISFLSNFLLKRLFKHDTKTKKKHVFNKIDFTTLIKEETDTPDENPDSKRQLKIFQNALEFSKVKLRDCMVPRPEICSIEKDSPLDELKQKFIETQYSKILVYDDSIDNIIGYISSKEFFKNPVSIGECLMKISFYPETMSANRLLRDFIKEKKNIAVVVDEFGGTSGIISIEDIIEEIFGEIEDEHDEEDLIHKKLSENSFVFSGRLEIDFINEAYNLNIPESDDYDTIAGFILHHNESIPKSNDELQMGKFKFKILKVSKTRLELIKMEIG